MNSNDFECPRCKTTKYRNPQLKLLVNICGHPLCENCIELMFASGTAKCYLCPTPLKRGNFKKQLFQDSRVEKDVQVRRDILRKFSRPQESFSSLREYNDYLEKLETIIYNLSNELDLDETNRLLDELRRPQVDAQAIKQEAKQVRELPYHHKIEHFDNEGPNMPKVDDRYLKAIRSFSTREIAGGFTAGLAINRALGEAFANLYSRHRKYTVRAI